MACSAVVVAGAALVIGAYFTAETFSTATEALTSIEVMKKAGEKLRCRRVLDFEGSSNLTLV